MDAILNWLWQGCALAAAAAACIRLARRATATTRYALWWIVLLLVLLLPVLPSVHFRTAAPAPGLPEAAAMGAPAPLVTIPAVPSLVLSAIGVAWALATLVSLGRTALDLVRLARARRSARPFPEQRESKLRHWCAVRGGGRRARVVTSGRVRLAAVLGFGEPLIAVSPAAARALSDEDLDRVLGPRVGACPAARRLGTAGGATDPGDRRRAPGGVVDHAPARHRARGGLRRSRGQRDWCRARLRALPDTSRADFDGAGPARARARSAGLVAAVDARRPAAGRAPQHVDPAPESPPRQVRSGADRRFDRPGERRTVRGRRGQARRAGRQRARSWWRHRRP